MFTLPVSSNIIMSSPKEQAVVLKNEGNKLFAAHNWQGAIDKYTEAIELDDSVPTYYSNRAQVHPTMLQLSCIV